MKRVAISVRYREDGSTYYSAIEAALRDKVQFVLLVRDVSELLSSGLSFQAVMQHVRSRIAECDVFVADVSEPGLGIAAEIGIAYALGKHILLYSFEESRFTPSVLAMGNAYHQIQNVDELRRLVLIDNEAGFQREISVNSAP